jgi:hypothetical protein
VSAPFFDNCATAEDHDTHTQEENFLVEFFSKKKVVLEVTIDLDAMPGAMHNGEYTQEYVQNLLNSMIGHYNPVVTMIKNDRPERITTNNA